MYEQVGIANYTGCDEIYDVHSLVASEDCQGIH